MVRFDPSAQEYEVLCDRCGFAIASTTERPLAEALEQFYSVGKEALCPVCFDRLIRPDQAPRNAPRRGNRSATP
jgi:hypothetical protein